MGCTTEGCPTPTVSMNACLPLPSFPLTIIDDARRRRERRAGKRAEFCMNRGRELEDEGREHRTERDGTATLGAMSTPFQSINHRVMICLERDPSSR
ncbi:hypothetical protein L5515_004039 [Caenorhabditis briggsae]|uniref:Uncharacterized protein n=1 Tax=Caenorhabditis briggsae TaxID=6238 RepID=A0AAE9JAH0_CAEBR|nr:hypothetical protein L5515_004039 [Caenorhabditis briggsae]